jgi:hypothetical protein
MAGAVVACATDPDEISTAYVSPLKYKNYDCDQIAMEMDHVSRRTTDLYFSLDKKADADSAQMGIGLVLFWPTLFFLEGGDGPEAAEYSRLKGEYEALRTTAIDKKCAMEDMPPSPEDIIEAKKEEEEKAREAAQSDETR